MMCCVIGCIKMICVDVMACFPFLLSFCFGWILSSSPGKGMHRQTSVNVSEMWSFVMLARREFSLKARQARQWIFVKGEVQLSIVGSSLETRQARMLYFTGNVLVSCFPHKIGIVFRLIRDQNSRKSILFSILHEVKSCIYVY